MLPLGPGAPGSIAATAFPGRPNEPFFWGRGGQRKTPEDIAAERERALQMQAAGADFSPVGHWTQGLARLATGISGQVQGNRLDEAEAANRAESGNIAALLMGQGEQAPTQDAVMQALLNPYADDRVRAVAQMKLEAMQPKASAPHYWETNNGSLGMIGPDGRPVILYDDPTPKLDWITAKNDDGTTQLIPVGPNGPMTGAPAMSGGSGQTVPPPPAMLPPDFNFDAGGPTQPASGGFPGSFRGVPGETVTSTYRDPARNARVGGVPNSYHTRRDARGNPMARDSVPPPGVSMAAHAEALRRLNPWAQVINEGDHVHMEPR